MRKNSFGEDKFDIQGRLEKVIDSLLTEFEQQPLHFGIKEKLAIVQYVSSYLARRARLDDGDESDTAGSAVRKYSGAFQTTNVAGKRGRNSRSAPTLAYNSDGDT